MQIRIEKDGLTRVIEGEFKLIGTGEDLHFLGTTLMQVNPTSTFAIIDVDKDRYDEKLLRGIWRKDVKGWKS